MKKIFEGTVKFLVIAFTTFLFFMVFRAENSWWPSVSFGFNLAIIASYVFMGGAAAVLFLFAAVIAGIIFIFKTLALEAPIGVFAGEIALSVIVFFLVKKAEDINKYCVFTRDDELKTYEAEYNACLIEEKNIKNALEASAAKLEKYRNLEEVAKGLSNHNVFSGKIRHVLRNVISMFHREKSIVLFLVRDGQFLKVEADKEDDMLSGQKDQESLFLKNFDEWVMQNGRSLIISDMQREVRFKAEKNETLRSIISVPVAVNGESCGVMRVSSEKPGVFSQEDLRFLDLVSIMLGKILEEEYSNAG